MERILSPLLHSSILRVRGSIPHLMVELDEIEKDQQCTLEAECEGLGLWESEVEGHEEADPRGLFPDDYRVGHVVILSF